jgi:DHA3 family macrolide efflux protein-like MFS transporter
VWADVREGLRYVMAWPALKIIIAMAMLINFLYSPAAMLMPLLVTNHFNGGVWHLGLIESAWGVGVVAGGLLLSIWGGFKSKLVTSMTGLIGMGAGALLVGLSPANAFMLAVVGYSLGGAMNPIVNGPLFAVLQSRVPPEKQARVFSLVNSSANAMIPLGTLVAAPVADWLGISAWFIAAGLATVAMGVLGFFIPALINFERDVKPVSEPAEPLAAIPTPANE